MAQPPVPTRHPSGNDDGVKGVRKIAARARNTEVFAGRTANSLARGGLCAPVSSPGRAHDPRGGDARYEGKPLFSGSVDVGFVKD